jgi:hypothetical protein
MSVNEIKHETVRYLGSKERLGYVRVLPDGTPFGVLASQS